MALIKCKNCGNEISDKAKRCPHCDIEIAVDSLVFKKTLIAKDDIPEGLSIFKDTKTGVNYFVYFSHEGMVRQIEICPRYLDNGSLYIGD